MRAGGHTSREGALILAAMSPRGRARVIVFAAMIASACGSSSSRVISAPTGDGITFGADIPVRITREGMRPELLHLYTGIQVTFVNEDGAPRTVVADLPRSDQAGCAAIAIGPLQPGERRTTSDLPRFTTCYFRDADRGADAAFQGMVVVH